MCYICVQFRLYEFDLVSVVKLELYLSVTTRNLGDSLFVALPFVC